MHILASNKFLILHSLTAECRMYEKRIVKSTVVMPYAAAKQLSIWLQKHLRNYEELAGHEIYVGEKELGVMSDTDRA